MCYGAGVGESVSVRELRNTVSEVLRRVERGEHVTVTVDRRPVAELVPLRRRRGVPVRDALALVGRQRTDRALLEDLRAALPDTTDDV
jgi:prevent-host-death family protein